MDGDQTEIEASSESLPELMKPYEAAKMLEEHFGGLSASKAEIVEKIRDGEIRAYAWKSWVSDNASRKQAWLDGPPPNAKKKHLIRRQQLLGSSKWERDSKNWRWRRGDFFISLKKKNRCRMYRKVRFAREDIEQVRDLADQNRLKRGAGGRKVNEDAWAIVWKQLLIYSQQGQLNFENFKTKDQLGNSIIAATENSDFKSLKLSTIKGQIALVWDQFINPERHTCKETQSRLSKKGCSPFPD